jgi:hypothetical protein
VNHTLPALRARLGRPARFQIDAEPSRRRRPVVATVRWDCGCLAEGPGFDALTLQACGAHAAAPSLGATLRQVPGLSSLLSRP